MADEKNKNVLQKLKDGLDDKAVEILEQQLFPTT